MPVRRGVRGGKRLWLLALACAAGCAGQRSGLAPEGAAAQAQAADQPEPAGFTLASLKSPAEWFGPKAPPGASDSLVLRGDKVEQEKRPAEGTGAAELAGALDLYRNGELGQAESIFHRLAENTKNSPQVAEEARYYEAECLRRQERYPKAADTYHKMLIDFPSGTYREQAVQRMFEIAQFWLEDTRTEMEERKRGQWFAGWPWVHFERTKPLLDEEGRAVEKLEQVRINDMSGPLADRALFLCGSVKFYRQDFREADHYFTQLVEWHPDSPLAPQAAELAIVAKNLSTGGSAYDGRKCAEARQMVDLALRSYPELAAKKGEQLERILYGINMQQAEKDYKTAEFYRWTGHAPSAYFYYEIVRRRYPGTKYFDLATQRMHDIRNDLEKAQARAADEKPREPVILKKGDPWYKKLMPGRPAEPDEMAPPPRPLPPGVGAGQPDVGPLPRSLPDQMPIGR